MSLLAVKYMHVCMTTYSNWWKRTARKKVCFYCIGFTAPCFGIVGDLSQNSEEFHRCQHLSVFFPLMLCYVLDCLIGLLYYCEMKCDTANPKSYKCWLNNLIILFGPQLEVMAYLSIIIHLLADKLCIECRREID